MRQKVKDLVLMGYLIKTADELYRFRHFFYRQSRKFFVCWSAFQLWSGEDYSTTCTGQKSRK
jgi:hypothetical protein